MKSYLGKILILSLLSLTTLFAIADSPPPKGCWFDTTTDTRQDYENTDFLNSYCPVPIAPADYYIGKVIDEDDAPECSYTSPEGTEGFEYNARWLNTTYDALKDIIKKHGSHGTFSENISQFNARFPSCTSNSQGHTSAITDSSHTSTDVASPSSYREICLMDERQPDGNRIIKIGYWKANQCQTKDNSPYYKKQSKQQPKAQATSEDGCPVYDPEEFSCEGYEFYRRGWAEECASVLGFNECYESTTCKKTDTPKDCCNYARKKECETVSRDKKGHCCCGVKINKDNDKCRNIGLRKK